MKYFIMAAMLMACGDKEDSAQSEEEAEQTEETQEDEEEQKQHRRGAWVYRCLIFFGGFK